MKVSMVACLAAAAMGAGASAQTSKLYMQDAQPYNIFNNQVRVAQGGTVNQTFDLNSPYEHNLVVAGDIRTYGGASYGQPGYRYDVNGGFQGQQYNPNGNYGSDAYYGPDAATDGQNYNWSYDYGWGYVMRFDRNWQNGTVAFGYNSNLGGITCNPQGNGGNGSLWLLETWASQLREVDYNGNTISGPYYDPALSAGYSALARDPADGTLWALQGNGSGDAWRQYDSNGQYITTGNYGYSAFTGSAEFDMNAVPAPGAAALLGVGGLVVSRRRRA